MEKKTIRSGAPFLLAGVGVFAFALLLGIGSLVSYMLAAGTGAVCFLLGKKFFPDRVIEVERAAQSGDAQVDALIAEARAQLLAIEAANEAIAEPQLSAQIDDIAATCRVILVRLEEQPTMLSSLRTFLRYYLPTVKKLLDERAKLEDEVKVGGSAQIVQRIREAMAQVQKAFDEQLQALEEFRFINLESEMDALSSMLKAEGLKKQAEVQDPAAQLDAQEEEEKDPFAQLFAQEGK